MSGDLRLLNRQRAKSVNTRLLRDMIAHLLADKSFDLAVHLVGPTEMARLNQKHLGHDGATDVITLDYAEETAVLAGEIFVCIAEAAIQARQFHTTWQSELARYVIHGLLHLEGHDDLRAPARRRMKGAENSRLKTLAGRFPLERLAMRAR
jgi:probable rRNA maturation factor